MNTTPNILLIAGSAEAHAIATQIAQTSQRMQAILRRAERSFGPLAVPSQVWSAASGDDMKNFLTRQNISAICDAGHGFDSDLSDIAAKAAAELGLPYMRLVRPMWPLAGDVARAGSVRQAAGLIRPDARVFAATGRGTVAEFVPFIGARLFLRQTSRKGHKPLPDFVEPVFGTPPFSIEDETALFQDLRIDTLICRNVGGAPSRPKLDAARALGLRCIVIDRPAPPKGVTVIGSAQEAVDWIASL